MSHTAHGTPDEIARLRAALADIAKPHVTPMVAREAQRLGVDVTSIKGTGNGGRVRMQDVRAAARPAAAPTSPSPASASPILRQVAAHPKRHLRPITSNGLPA